MLTALKNYIIGAWKEIRKVQWPTLRETWRYSLIIVGVSVAVAGFIAGVDWILDRVVNTVI